MEAERKLCSVQFAEFWENTPGRNDVSSRTNTSISIFSETVANNKIDQNSTVDYKK